MKGIILAGGSGKRLHPITLGLTKQLLPIYDKPLVYYPLCTLMDAKIRDILIIVKPEDLIKFKLLFGNGKQWGINISYAIQKKPKGIAEAFIIGKKFIKDDSVCLILGDNIFFGIDFSKVFYKNFDKFKGGMIFTFNVPDPERYGVISFKKNKIVSIEEKPKNPKSNFAVTGLYFYDNKVVNIIKKIKPSKRNELEITDINKYYLKNKELDFHKMPPGSVWLDAGTEKSLLQAAHYVQTIQERQNIQIACPEVISLKNKWISKKIFNNLAQKYAHNLYGQYLRKIAKLKNF